MGYVEGCFHGDHQLRKVVHLLIVLCLEGINLCLANTTQYHRLRISVQDDIMYHVHAWEREISACNLVQARLVNVHRDFAIFKIFPKCA